MHRIQPNTDTNICKTYKKLVPGIDPKTSSIAVACATTEAVESSFDLKMEEITFEH